MHHDGWTFFEWQWKKKWFLTLFICVLVNLLQDVLRSEAHLETKFLKQIPQLHEIHNFYFYVCHICGKVNGENRRHEPA